MVTTFRIEIDPSPKKLASLFGDRVPKLMKDYRPAWRQLLPVLAQEMSKTIESEGKNLGVRWAPLKRGTVARKKRAGQSGAALQGTGRLLAQVSSKTKGKVSLTRTKVVFGPNKDSYKFIQNFGSRRRGLPARQYIGLTRNMRESALNFMDDLVGQRLDKIASEFERLR